MADLKTTCWNEAVNGMADEIKDEFVKRKDTDEDFSTAIYAKYQLFLNQAKSDPKKGFEVMTTPLKRKAEDKGRGHTSGASSSGGVSAAASQRETQHGSRASTETAEENWTDQNYYQRWSGYNWWKYSRW